MATLGIFGLFVGIICQAVRFGFDHAVVTLWAIFIGAILISCIAG